MMVIRSQQSRYPPRHQHNDIIRNVALTITEYEYYLLQLKSWKEVPLITLYPSNYMLKVDFIFRALKVVKNYLYFLQRKKVHLYELSRS